MFVPNLNIMRNLGQDQFVSLLGSAFSLECKLVCNPNYTCKCLILCIAPAVIRPLSQFFRVRKVCCEKIYKALEDRKLNVSRVCHAMQTYLGQGVGLVSSCAWYVWSENRPDMITIEIRTVEWLQLYSIEILFTAAHDLICDSGTSVDGGLHLIVLKIFRWLFFFFLEKYYHMLIGWFAGIHMSCIQPVDCYSSLVWSLLNQCLLN